VLILVARGGECRSSTCRGLWVGDDESREREREEQKVAAWEDVRKESPRTTPAETACSLENTMCPKESEFGKELAVSAVKKPVSPFRPSAVLQHTGPNLSFPCRLPIRFMHVINKMRA
jgi:hypothetical protein